MVDDDLESDRRIGLLAFQGVLQRCIGSVPSYVTDVSRTDAPIKTSQLVVLLAFAQLGSCGRCLDQLGILDGRPELHPQLEEGLDCRNGHIREVGSIVKDKTTAKNTKASENLQLLTKTNHVESESMTRYVAQ